MWQRLVLMALAGGAGACTRFLMGGLVLRITGDRFPWGTFAVNAVGCFLFGLIWALAEDHLLIVSVETRLVVLTGFMGAFTTFSTFAFETTELLQESQWLLAAGNMLGQNVLGLVCIFLGLAVSRML